MVEDFEQHIQYMDFFHKRYIPTGKLLSIWVNTVTKAGHRDHCAPARGAYARLRKRREVSGLGDYTALRRNLMDDVYPCPGTDARPVPNSLKLRRGRAAVDKPKILTPLD